MRRLLTASFCLAALLAGTACAEEPKADPENQEQVAHGAKVYAVACASCHGADLEGQPDWQVRKEDGRLPAPPHDESGHTWHHADKLLFEITKFGPAALVSGDYQSDMIPFEDSLTDEEIWASIAFIKSQWPEAIRQRQAAMNKAAEE